MDKMDLVNKLFYVLEMNQKKNESSPESKILVDKNLEKMRDYFIKIKLDEFKEHTKADKGEVIKYDKEFFRENIPLKKIIVVKDNHEPYETNPLNNIEFRKRIRSSYVEPIKISSGKYKGKIGFEPILIKDHVSKLTYGCIGHEVVHTQIEQNPNLLTNYYNREVLSIFVEMIISKSIDDKTLDNIIRYRFENVYECISDLSYYEDMIFTSDSIAKFRCYLSSSLKALHLYDKYRHSSRDKRIEILSLIEDIFCGKLTVEQFLDKMNVTYKNSKDVDMVKHYVKKY